MKSRLTAETVFQDFRKLPKSERAKFFSLLSDGTFGNENFTHDDVFGHLTEEDFTSAEAAEFLQVSMSTFRRYVSSGRLKVASEMGRNQLFSAADLKSFKRSLREVKGE